MEWDLLVQSEAIEPGRMITVDEEDGSTSSLKFRKKQKGAVHLAGEDGTVRRFDPDSLEEIGGSAMISGAAD